MKFNELSLEDQELLSTDLGEFDKIAAAELAEADELFAFGMEKAAAAADEADEEEEEEKRKELPEHLKKEAAAKGAFIAQGMIEKLAALGEERHGDELHYFYPAIQEKLAAAGNEAGKKLLSKLKMESITRAPGRFAKNVKENFRKAISGEKYKDVTDRAISSAQKHPELRSSMEKLINKNSLTKGQRFAEGAKGLGKASIPVGVAGGAAYGTHKLLKGKKKEE